MPSHISYKAYPFVSKPNNVQDMENEGDSALLLVRVEEQTSRSQFLAHFSFTPESRPRTGLQIRGGVRDVNSGSVINHKSVCSANFCDA